MRVIYLGPRDSLQHVQSCLSPHFDVIIALDDAAVDEAIEDCDVILDAYMKIPFRAERVNRAKNLKLFVTATTGADHISALALNQRGIPLMTLQGQTEILGNISAAAEHSWLLLMACARRLRGAIREVLEGKWDRNNHPGTMLKGRTLGIIGCGRIGQWMGRYASGFEMRCFGYDPYVEPWPSHIEKTSLKSLLELADFVSVHVPLNEETHGMLGENEFRMMKRGVVFINTSRGEIVDELVLLSALAEEQISMAGLDVIIGEPEISNHPLVQFARENERLIITPHIGGFSPDALQTVLEFTCRRISNFFEGRARG